MTPELINIIFTLGGALVMFIAHKKGWVSTPVNPALPVNPVTPIVPSPVVPVPDGGLLAVIKAFLDNPVIGPIVRAEIEKLIAAIRARILPPVEPPTPPAAP